MGASMMSTQRVIAFGDPEECRQHVATYKRLASEAEIPEAREHFIDLAVQWERLAAELEMAQRSANDDARGRSVS